MPNAPGSIDYYCECTHGAIPKYSKRNVDEMKTDLVDRSQTDTFEEYRVGAIKSLGMGAERLRNLTPETVDHRKTTSFNMENTGNKYTNAAWQI